MAYTMTDGTFITVQAWMATELGLSGNALLLYAYVYGWTESSGGYTGTAEAACEVTGIRERKTFRSVMEGLMAKGYIQREQVKSERGNRYRYTAVKGVKITPYESKGVKITPYGENTSSAGFSGSKGVKITPYAESKGVKITSLGGKNYPPDPNNIIYNLNTHKNSARAREDAGGDDGLQPWADEVYAARLAEALRVGGQVRDDIMCSLTRTGALADGELGRLFDTFVALQRSSGSTHISDGDFRGHFTRWAVIQRREEARERGRNATAYERAELARRQAAERYRRDMEEEINRELYDKHGNETSDNYR